MKSLPLFLKKYFWDVDFYGLSKEKYAHFIIERVLEEGDDKAVKWLNDNFTVAEVKKVFARSRRLSPRSASFWQLTLNIKRGKAYAPGDYSV